MELFYTSGTFSSPEENDYTLITTLPLHYSSLAFNIISMITQKLVDDIFLTGANKMESMNNFFFD